MTIGKIGAAIFAGATFLAAFAPAHAASLVTDAFLANATPNIDFLDRSSRFALTNSKTARLRDFARSEAREQTLAANQLDGWIETSKGSTLVASAAGGELQTGRSVAIDGRSAPQEQLVDMRLPMGQEDLDRLEGLNGAEFDAMYKDKQRVALRQLQSDYEEYLVRGDDADLLAMAKSELPKIKRRLTAIGKL